MYLCCLVRSGNLGAVKHKSTFGDLDMLPFRDEYACFRVEMCVGFVCKWVP